MSALKPDTATSKPVKEEDNTSAPAKKKNKKKGKIPGINNVLYHKNGVREYIYGFPIHGMATGKSRYPNLSKSSVVVLVGGGGSTKSGIQNSIQINGCEIDKDGTLGMKQLLNYDCGDLISNITISKDGQLIACSIGGECRLYKFRRGDEVKINQIGQWKSDFHTSYPCINVLNFNESGTKLVTGGDDNVVKVYHLELVDNKKFAVSTAVKLEGHKRAVLDAKFSPVGNLLATSSRDGKCIIWKLNSNKTSNSNNKDDDHNDASYSICTTLNASEIKQKFGESMKDARKRGQPFFNCLQWSQTKNCTYLYGVECTKRGPSTLVQWKVNIKQVAFKEISRTKLTKDPICSLSVSGNGKLIVVGDSKGFVQLLNVNLVTSDVEILGTTGKNVHSLAITGVDFVKLENNKYVPIACSPDSTSTVLPFDENFQNVFEEGGNMILYLILGIFTIFMLVLLIGLVYFPEHELMINAREMGKEFGIEL
jgi:WD40 repeat protein